MDLEYTPCEERIVTAVMLTAEVERLRATLDLYADELNWRRRPGCEHVDLWTRVCSGYDPAREALGRGAE